LFGRNRDAQILCDRTLSSRLTILYGQSGLGKSSLLRALAIPKLEEGHARVVYFDSWAQEDPLHALKEELIGLASAIGVTDAGRGSPTLVELVRMLNNVDEQSVVLILDQFEEFLVNHAQALDPLRDELAALVRAPRVDAAVVLSLREEFLAALEPFRQQILNLFQSAYRLEPLSEPDLRDAIRRPAEEFGGSCRQDMADQLIQELRGAQDDRSSGGPPLVELPMLQLVCQELWKHATDGQLSRELYESMGGAQRIIDRYVRELMPKRSREQRLTARLLVPLAPPSGLKMSYTVEDLSSMTGLDPAAIADELERLSQARILRTRQHRGRRYELEHDAFIPVLSAWRNHVLDHDRQMRHIWRLVMACAVVAAVTSLLVLYKEAQSRTAQELRFRKALSSLSVDDPLTSALALGELGDSRIAAQAVAELRQAAVAAIPAAVLRDREAQAPGQPLLGAWFTSDSRRVATVSKNGTLRLWSADGKGKPAVLQITGGAGPSAVAVSPDLQWVAAGFENGDLQLRRVSGTEVVRIPQAHLRVTALALSPNSERILAAYADYSVRIWNRDGGHAVVLGSPKPAHFGEILSLQFDARGERVLTASLDGTAKIWAVDRPGTPLAVFRDDKLRAIYSAALSPDGKRVICGLADGAARIWNSETKGDFDELKGHDEVVISASFSPDGLKVVTGSSDRSSRVWDLRLEAGAGGARLTSLGSPMILRGHTGTVSAVAFSPDGSRILTASADGTARIWWSESKEPRILGNHTKPIEKVVFSRDGNKVATASRDATVTIWTLAGSINPITLKGHTDWVRSVGFSPDGRTVVTGSEDQTAGLWDLESGRKQFRKVPGLFTVAFTPDAAGIITGTRETGGPTVEVWPANPSAAQPFLRIEKERQWVYCVAFSPDGSRIVTGSFDGTARIWTREPGKWAVKDPPVTLLHRDRVFSALFSPDGSKIATSSADGQVRIWDLSGRLLSEFAHSKEVWQIAFSSDGKLLVTSCLDNTAKIWDVEHGALLMTLSHPAGVRAAAFRPRTTEVVTGADDGRVRVWRTDVGQLLDYMKGSSTACLTPSERVRFLGESENGAGSAYAKCEALNGR
jgi:WD40 repeat protein